MTVFGYPLVGVSDAINVLEPELNVLELRDVWRRALSAASKSAAHFTEDGATIHPAELGWARYATSRLVRSESYEVNGRKAPSTTLDERLIPTKADPVWNAGRLFSRYIC